MAFQSQFIPTASCLYVGFRCGAGADFSMRCCHVSVTFVLIVYDNYEAPFPPPPPPPESLEDTAKWAISELPSASVSKRVQVQNLSYENEFDLHLNGLVSKTDFNVKVFALGHLLKQRQKATRKWSIYMPGP